MTLTLPPARLGVPASCLGGSTSMLDTVSPGGIVSTTATVEPTGKVGPIMQVPPGAGPAGTASALVPAVNMNGVPIAIPGPATLQTLSRPGSQAGPVALPRLTPAATLNGTGAAAPMMEPAMVALFDTGPQAV